MKKVFKLITIVGTINVMTISSCFYLTSCLTLEINNKHSENASLLKWNNLSWNDKLLVKKYEAKIHKPASTKSIDEFDNLYDNNKEAPIWSNYQALENDLTHTKIGNHIISINWTKIYKNISLNENQIRLAQQEQLRFYNIFSKVYNENNVLRLIQKIEPVSVSDHVIAWTAFNRSTNSQRMGYGPDFANAILIKNQYNTGFWSSNKIISVSTHEYGHALSNFLGVKPWERAKFNTNWNWKDEQNSNLTVSLRPSYYKTITNNHGKSIANRAEYLFNYLAKQANITNWKQKLLFGLVVVDSNYGRSAWSSQFIPGLEDEFFAESFASWLLTPKSHRNWAWELKNDFFLHYLPQVL